MTKPTSHMCGAGILTPQSPTPHVYCYYWNIYPQEPTRLTSSSGVSTDIVDAVIQECLENDRIEHLFRLSTVWQQHKFCLNGLQNGNIHLIHVFDSLIYILKGDEKQVETVPLLEYIIQGTWDKSDILECGSDLRMQNCPLDYIACLHKNKVRFKYSIL